MPMPIGIMVDTKPESYSLYSNTPHKSGSRLIKHADNVTVHRVEGLRMGWAHDFDPKWDLIRKVNFFMERDRTHGLSMGLYLDLFPWDNSDFVSNKAGILHTLRNPEGNVRLTQIVASPKALPDMLSQLIRYSSTFMILHCKLPKLM